MKLELHEQSSGQRIDKAIADALLTQGVSCSRSRLAQAFQRGEVKVAGKAVKASLRVDCAVGQSLEVELEIPQAPPLAKAFPEKIELSILYEDEDVLVVDKAAGMVVHAGAGHDRGTLVNAVLYHLGVDAAGLPLMPGNPETRPGIVHRIDRNTSGLLVVAKTDAAQETLATQFRKHTVRRDYLAFCTGIPDWTRRSIKTTHRRDPNHRMRFAPGGPRDRLAISHVKVEGFSSVGSELTMSLLRFRLKTGRTHQIRMHARFIGYPLIGDALYGSRPNHDALKQWVQEHQRHALHATTLGFELPDGRSLDFESPLPPELVDLKDLMESGSPEK